MNEPKRIFRHAIRVGYVDTDRGDVVHHTAYLRYLEAARIELLRELGVDYRLLELEQHFALPVVEISLRYRAPARFDEVILAETLVTMVGRATVRFFHSIERKGEKLVEGFVTVGGARLDERRVASLPGDLREKLERVAARTDGP